MSDSALLTLDEGRLPQPRSRRRPASSAISVALLETSATSVFFTPLSIAGKRGRRCPDACGTVSPKWLIGRGPSGVGDPLNPYTFIRLSSAGGRTPKRGVMNDERAQAKDKLAGLI